MTASRRMALRTRAAHQARLTLPLRTRRLLLREFRREDFEGLCRYACDPRVTRFLFLAPRDPSEAEEYLERVLGYQQEKPRTAWEMVIEERHTGRQIGACNLTMIARGEADLGYMFHHDVWGKGFATELALALRDAAFRDLAIERVISTVDIRNAASIRVLEKIGLRWEATFRRHRHARGQYRDCHLFAMPRVEWKHQSKNSP